MKVFYSEDVTKGSAQGKKIAIIGYGIIGRGKALNLRDSGFDVVIGNRDDEYRQQAKDDGFEVMNIDDAAKHADVLFILLPDQAQKSVYESFILPYLDDGNMLVFAHGFSIHFKEIEPPDYVDVCLLAPRMPGKPMREYYLAGGGIPAFVAVRQDATGTAQNVILNIAEGLGYTKAGVMYITFKEETEIDLFIEQFLLPTIMKAIRLSFDTLVEEGFTPESTLMELYASGEIGELILMAAQKGIYEVWRKNASPTCQYGIFRNTEYVLPTDETKQKIKHVLSELRDGTFLKSLHEEASTGYAHLKAYDKENQNSLIEKTQENLQNMIKFRR